MQVRARAFTRLGLAPVLLGATALSWLSTTPGPAVREEEEHRDPADVVARFCELDFDGVRLNGTNPGWKEYRSLITPHGDWPEEPIAITKRYRVTRVQRAKQQATVIVKYNLLGHLRGGLESDRVESGQASENVAFPLVGEAGSWKIKAFELPPHVSAPALRKHVQGIMEDDEKQGDSHRMAILQTLLAKLDALSK